jgi:uncharacterized membrane protein HdeD (DUF308 family)
MERGQAAGTILASGATALCKRTWWVFLIGGIASVVFGILAFLNPGIALLVLGLYLAAYLLVDGAGNVWGAIQHREKDGWWAMLLLGILGVGIGLYALFVPAVSMMAIVYMVSFMALLMGLSSLVLGWKIRKEISTEWVLYLTGALSVLFALMILFRPVVGTLSVVYLIATWAILVGLARVFFAFRIRQVAQAGG